MLVLVSLEFYIIVVIITLVVFFLFYIFSGKKKGHGYIAKICKFCKKNNSIDAIKCCHCKKSFENISNKENIDFQYIVNEDKVPIRKTPDVYGKSEGSLKKGEKIAIIEYKKNDLLAWVHLKREDESLWWVAINLDCFD